MSFDEQKIRRYWYFRFKLIYDKIYVRQKSLIDITAGEIIKKCFKGKQQKSKRKQGSKTIKGIKWKLVLKWNWNILKIIRDYFKYENFIHKL